MIRVKVKILGNLIRTENKEEFIVVLKKASSITDLLRQLNYNEHHIKSIITTVNGNIQSHFYILKDNDNVALKTVIGGG